MKKIIILILLCLCVFPNTIKAGIICNDGWESSCPFPGPGCCSHHGGIPGGSDYSNSYSGGDGFGGLILIGFGFLMVVGIYQTIKEKFEQSLKESNTNNKNKREEDKKIYTETYNNYVEHSNTILENETQEEEIFTCGACGKDVEENAVFCPECGAKFEEEEEEKTYMCGACGTEVSQDDVECPSCGATFEDAEEEEEELEEEKIYTCGACGTEVSQDDVECPSCGATFEDDN